MNKKELSIAGVFLYACEGTKLRRDKRFPNTFYYTIEFTNATPELVRIFVRFLKDVLEVEKRSIKGQLFFYEDHNEQASKRFWSKQVRLPLSQFQQSISLRSKNTRYAPNPNGVLKIRVLGKQNFLKLQRMMKRHIR